MMRAEGNMKPADQDPISGGCKTAGNIVIKDMLG